MQNNPQLPPGFITVDEAIALIKKDKRDNAVVDLKFLVDNIPYLQKRHNYNIRLLKTVKDEATGQNKTVRNGTVYVPLATEYDAQILLHAITDAYRERTNIAISEDALGVNCVTTMIDEQKSISDVRPRINEEAGTQIGTDISRPYEQIVEAD